MTTSTAGVRSVGFRGGKLELMDMLGTLWVRWRFAIIGLLLACNLAACSAVRLGYSNAPALANWWLDGYLDFDDAQSTRVRMALQELHDWHRREELPRIAELLQDMQTTTTGALPPAEACRLGLNVEARVQSLIDRAIAPAAAVLATVSPSQLEHLQSTFNKRNRDWREEWMDLSPQALTQARLTKLTERAEMFYGSVSDAQTALMRSQIAASGFDPALQYRENLRRQQDTLQVIRSLQAPGITDAQARAALAGLAERTWRSPDAAYAAYFERLRQDSCNYISRFHALATPAQRTRLQQTLKGYETDARALTLGAP